MASELRSAAAVLGVLHFIAQGQQAGDPFVVGSQELGKDPGDVGNVAPAGHQHLLQIGPVLAEVEEALEHGQIVTAQEGEFASPELVVDDVKVEVDVESGGVQEVVHRDLLEVEAALPHGIELPCGLLGDVDARGEGDKDPGHDLEGKEVPDS